MQIKMSGNPRKILSIEKAGGKGGVVIKDSSEFTGNLDYDGSIYTFLGEVRLLGHTFSSKADEPLSFKLVKDKGMIHVSGKGIVTTDRGEKIVIE